MSMPTSLTQKNDWDTNAAKAASTEFIDQCADASRNAAKKAAHEAIDGCASSLQSLKEAGK